MKHQAGNYDCLVIGGGLLGLMSARFLAESGVAVAILEQGRVGSESSWGRFWVWSPRVTSSSRW